MYIPERRIAIIQITKCGSQSLREVIDGHFGKCPHPGHLTEQQMVEQCKRFGQELDEVWALIRDPFERFMSGLNFVYGDTDVTLAQAMQEILSGHARKSGKIVFTPQVDFLNGGKPKRLWRFEDMDDMLDELGVAGRIHKNKSKKRWYPSNVKRWQAQIDDMLAVDAPIRERAVDGGRALG